MPKALKENKEFVVIDIETTGLSRQKGAEILEIAAVLVDTEERKIKKSIQSLLSIDNGKIPAKISEITGITNEMIENAPQLKGVLYSLYTFIGNRPLVFHNAGFDWDRFLDPEFRKVGLCLQNDIIDSLEIAKLLFGKGGNNLESLCNRYGISSKGAHRAIVDAKNTAIVLTNMRSELTPELILKNGFTKEKAVLPPLKIGCYKYWEKKISTKKTYRRIYVATNWGQAYYDLNKNSWFISEPKYEVNTNFREIENSLIKFAKVDSFAVLIEATKKKALENTKGK